MKDVTPRHSFVFIVGFIIDDLKNKTKKKLFNLTDHLTSNLVTRFDICPWRHHVSLSKEEKPTVAT